MTLFFVVVLWSGLVACLRHAQVHLPLTPTNIFFFNGPPLFSTKMKKAPVGSFAFFHFGTEKGGWGLKNHPVWSGLVACLRHAQVHLPLTPTDGPTWRFCDTNLSTSFVFAACKRRFVTFWPEFLTAGKFATLFLWSSTLLICWVWCGD